MASNIKEHLSIVDGEIIFNQALCQALNHLRENWFNENVGIVAATLVEKNQMFSATSLFLPHEDRWLHAEAAVLQQFKNRTGRKPLKSSTLVVTLSPCLLESSSRLGGSCTRIIIDSEITQVRFGCLDVTQTPDIQIYSEMGLDVKLTGDPISQQVCCSLYGLFDQLYKANGRFHHLLNNHKNPWQEIKRITGQELFRT